MLFQGQMNTDFLDNQFIIYVKPDDFQQIFVIPQNWKLSCKYLVQSITHAYSF